MSSRRREIFEPSEDQITAAVVAHWRTFGVPGSLVASIPNKRAFGQPGLTKGLPDLLVLSPSLPVGFIEQKRNARSIVSPAQYDFQELCERLDVPHFFAVGRDEPIAILKSWGAIR